MESRIRWKRWECPACLNGRGIEDPEYIYATSCGNDHMCIIGNIAHSQNGYDVWAELDDHFYTKEDLDNLMKSRPLSGQVG